MAVVVEPIVTLEKLRALLDEQSEHSTLDYKSTLNLSKGNAEGLVELVKDVAALQSEANGGYIVIGADDHGQPTATFTPELAHYFDEAALRPKLEKYLTNAKVRSAIHTLDGNTFALMYVEPSEIGWGIFHAPGEYEKNGKKCYVFRVGDVFVRHGTSSERWTDADRERLVGQIVARHKEQWRQEWTQQELAKVELGLSVSKLGAMPSGSLDWQLDSTTFTQLATELLRRDDDVPLRQLLTRAPNDLSEALEQNDTDQTQLIIDRVTTLAALAIQYDRGAWLNRAVDTFGNLYNLGFDEHGFDRNGIAIRQLWLDIVSRVYALGGLAVRLNHWHTVRTLTSYRPTGQSIHRYGTWLRHALTMASRAGLIQTEEASGLLGRAHNCIRTTPALNPDYPAEHFQILNSLCQFDVFGALVVIGEQNSTDVSLFFTNFARYQSNRSEPAFITIVSNPNARQTLFDGDDLLLAKAIREIAKRAHIEGFNYNGWIGLEAPAVAEFLKLHSPANP